MVLAALIFLYPKQEYSPVPSQWDVSLDWGRYYIIQEGHTYIYNVTDYALTYPSDKRYGAEDVMPKIFFATLNIITGTTTFPNDLTFHYNFPWQGVLFLPIISLYFFSYLSKKEKREINYFDLCLLYLFSAFPPVAFLHPLVGNTYGNGIARGLFLFVLTLLLIIFNEPKRDIRKVGLLVLLFLYFPLFYHTWTYYLAIMVVALVFLMILRKTERIMSLLLIFGFIIFLIAAIFLNKMLLVEITNILNSFPKILANFPSVSYITKVNPQYAAYSPLGSVYSYLQLISALLLLSICLIFFFGYLKHKKEEVKPYENMLFYFFGGLLLIGVALFVWEGVFGIYSRIFEPLLPISVLLAGHLLVNSKGKVKNLVRFILLLVPCICIISYLTYQTVLNISLTNEEFKGISFVGENIPKTSYIFSDFRIGTPLMYYNQSAIITPSAEYTSPNITEEILERVYYHVSNPEKILDSFINSRNYYVLTSSYQSETAINDPSLKSFKPASEDFQTRWESQISFSKIYSSNYINVFRRNQ